MPTTRGAALKRYLAKIADIRASGHAVDELSYYPALSELFDQIGSRLAPQVKPVMNIRNTGGGLPDGGLFTADQVRRRSSNLLASSIPGRGAIEAKGTGIDIDAIFKSEQTKSYSKRYGQVLLTNLRAYALVVDDTEGRRIVDSISLADDERTFWELVNGETRPRKELAEQFEDFLVRALLRGAPLREAHDIAMLLASFAREAAERMPVADPPGLLAVRDALEKSLGLKFKGDDGDHFFHSTLIQTLFYGVFSAWVLWSKEPQRKATDKFQWHDAAWHLHVPMVRSLFEQVATPSMLGPLRMAPILDAVADALNRVDRRQFFKAFDTGHTVQHFYEPFLQKFDPVLRKKMGVWFTPPEIVEYMVARVDRVLREELNLADGLADERVYLLDPCAGTGSFLVAALHKIGEHLGVGKNASAALKLKKIALTRIFGFELIPAPFVVSHLQVGLLLQSIGAPLKQSGNREERAQVYLSNALTGWRAEDDTKLPLPFPQFTEERDAANRVKRDTPIIVIIGNPPYDGFSGVSPEEEQGLIDPYKEGLKEWGFTKNKLDDPYIRFFRIAENRISQHEPYRGIVCYVSNYSWVNHKTAAPVRQSLLSHFDQFWIDNLHGNRQISEYGPDGKSSETIFALEGFSPGIRQGVVISLWLKRSREHLEEPVVLYRDDFNDSRADARREHMVHSLSDSNPDSKYVVVRPEQNRYYSLKPAAALPKYREWPSIEDICKLPASLGLNENRKGALIDIQRDALIERMRAYFDGSDAGTLRRLGGAGLLTDAARFDAQSVKTAMRGLGFSVSSVHRFLYHPFDKRWAYVAGHKLWNEWRPQLARALNHQTVFIVYRKNAVEPNDGVPLLASRDIGDQHAMHKDAYFIPLHYATSDERGGHVKLFDDSHPNLSDTALEYLKTLGYSGDQIAKGEADMLWYHFVAIANSGQYMAENADDLAVQAPRFPLPFSREMLLSSAAIGQQIAAITDLDQEIDGLSRGRIATNLASVAAMRKTKDGTITEEDLWVTAGWGRVSKNGITGGRGKIVVWENGKPVETEDEDEIETASGVVVLDIYINENVCFGGIPREVWQYSVAGYQVLKKWLSYRESVVLKRPLDVDEAREFSQIAQRIAAILVMGERLDANYRAVKGSHGSN
jgi:hypothetical protein